jgi:hypothetical protein
MACSASIISPHVVKFTMLDLPAGTQGTEPGEFAVMTSPDGRHFTQYDVGVIDEFGFIYTNALPEYEKPGYVMLLKNGVYRSGSIRDFYVPPWSPLQIPGLVAWYDIDSLAGTWDMDPVNLWEDSSGNDNHAIAIPGINSPRYIEFSQGGKASLLFNTVSGLGAAASASLNFNDHLTIAFVGKTGGGVSRLQTFAVLADDWISGGFMVHRNNPWHISFGIVYNNGDWAQFTNDVWPENTWNSHIIRVGSPTNEWLQDNVSVNSEAFVSYTGRNAPLTIGCFAIPGWTPFDGIQGNMSELCIFNQRITDANTTALWSYFKGRYALPA